MDIIELLKATGLDSARILTFTDAATGATARQALAARRKRSVRFPSS